MAKRKSVTVQLEPASVAAETQSPTVKGQRRALTTPDLAIQQPERYRAGVEFELQKFGGADKESEIRQLYLTEQPEDERERESFGLDLSTYQLRSVHAILVLLDKTDYQGNLEGRYFTDPAANPFGYVGLIPRLLVSHSEYLDAFELQKTPSGQYSPHQRQKAIEALESLEGTWRVGFKYRSKNGWKATIVEGPLIHLWRYIAYDGLDDEEMKKIEAGEDVPDKKRATGLEIEFSPIFMRYIDTFYTLRPIKLYGEIQALLGSRRYSPALPLFLDWLFIKNKTPWKIAEDKLISRLRLDSWIRQRKKSKAIERIQEAIQVALELGYLLSYNVSPFGIYTFHLNPDRAGRPIEIKETPEEEEDDEEDSDSSV